MAKRSDVKTYRPNAFVPTTSYTGAEQPLILKGENMWVRIGRFGSVYAEGYSGNLDKSETIATKTLTGTIAWTSGSKTITGTGTAFLNEVHLGSFMFSVGASNVTQLFVVEKIVSDTSVIISRAPDASASGKTAYILPVIFPVGTDRGTAFRGNALRYTKGHYLGVGDGLLAINGSTTLGVTTTAFTLARTPKFALHNAITNAYVEDDVGIDKPTDPITISALTIDPTITDVTEANPMVVTVAGTHGIYTGQTVTISGVTGAVSANGTFTATKLTAATFSINVDGSMDPAYIGPSGTIVGPNAQMRAGGYNVRVCSKSTSTLGFSQPSNVIAPVTLTAGQMIKIVFNSAMHSDQDAYDVYCSPFEDNSTTTIESRYMGPWFLVRTVTAAEMVDNTYTTGRAAGASIAISFSDAEISANNKLLSFDNFAPKPAEFVDLINGIPLYFSCLGEGNNTTTTAAKTEGTSPGPVAIPSKPSNPEAVFLNKAITTAGGDTIIGEFNAKARIYVLCQNSLQTLVLTTLDEEPIAFRSLWNSGFRNPYNVAFVKEYLYGFSTQKFVRSVAGGDDSAMEFEFASDVRDYTSAWETGHVLVGYDPKNRAVVYFYTAAERRNGYWVTIALPFLLDKQIWSTPIILQKSDQDFIVSGVTTIGQELTFLAGGRTSGGSISVGTYVFDGGDSESKSWYLAWNYSDDGFELHSKTIKGLTFTGRLTSVGSSIFQLHGLREQSSQDTFDFTSLADGTNYTATYTLASTGGFISRKKYIFGDWNATPLYTVRISGVYTTQVDRLDEVAIKVEVNNSER